MLQFRSAPLIRYAIAASVLGTLVSGGASFADASRCTPTARGRLLNTTVLDYMTPSQLEIYFAEFMVVEADYINNDVTPRIEYGAEIYKIDYCTIDFDGSPTVASGVLSIPVRQHDQPPHVPSTVLYEHGTSVTRNDTVTNLDVEVTFDGPTPLVYFTGAGYIYIAADYLGFGDNDLPRHHYLHAESEATSVQDLYTAAKRSWPYRSIAKTDKLFLFGASQGGHVSMALQRKLESDPNGPTVTAHATMGGIYDPEAWLLDMVFAKTGFAEDVPVYPPYIVLTYQDVYHVFTSINSVFQPPLNRTVEGLYDMSHPFLDVQAALPIAVTDEFKQTFLRQLQTNADLPLRVRLRENEVFKWTPRGPITFFHSLADDEVPYHLGLETYNYMRAHGAPITLRTLQGLDHLNTWNHTMPMAIEWFDTF
jgi:hypothetical protein